jgi:hypothetical protein
MKKIKLFVLAAFGFVPFSPVFGQLNMAGFGASQGLFQAKDVNIKNNLTGGHAFLETPLGKYSLRADVNYLVRLGEKTANTSNIDDILGVRIGYGKVIGEGKTLQFPFFGSGSYYATKGNLQLKNYGLGVRGGFRIFISERIAFYVDVNGDYIFGKKVKFENLTGVVEEKNLNPIQLQLNVGFMYMYLKKTK